LLKSPTNESIPASNVVGDVSVKLLIRKFKKLMHMLLSWVIGASPQK